MGKVEKDPAGVEMYEKVLGKPEPADKPLTGLRELGVNHLFAKVWSRPGLGIRERRLVTLALCSRRRDVATSSEITCAEPGVARIR